LIDRALALRIVTELGAPFRADLPVAELSDRQVREDVLGYLIAAHPSQVADTVVQALAGERDNKLLPLSSVRVTLLRLFGAKIGKGVWMDMTDITEFDCVKVGDYSVLNAMCALQTHLYEDRVMKVGRVHVDAGVTVGAGSTVLYDTHVGRFARLGPLTVIMKGEAIPANTEWVGAPAQPRRLAVVEAAPASA
jgi:hypothetical protein